MGDVVDLSGGGDSSGADVDATADQSEMEHAIENVADGVCAAWEVFGSDVSQSVMTVVDGHVVRVTVEVEVM